MPASTDTESASRHYEIAMLVHPRQSDQVPDMMSRYRKIVKEHGGVVHREEDWGRRPLAYLIDNLSKAHYLLMNVEGSPAMLAELKSAFQYNDAVLRNLAVRRARAISEISPIMQETIKEKERARQQEAQPEGRGGAKTRYRAKADDADATEDESPAESPDAADDAADDD